MKGHPGPIDPRRMDLNRTIYFSNTWLFRDVRPNARWRTFSLCWWWLAISLFVYVGIGAKAMPTNVLGSAAIPQNLDDNPEMIKYWDPLELYLTRYGYLSSGTGSVMGGGNLRSEEQFRDSIKIMQRFGNIPATGRIDMPTIQLMSKKRCGMPDLVGSSERVRRFAVQGQRWAYTNLTWSIRDWPSNVDSSMVRRELAKALKIWSDVSKLEFEEIRSTKADIVVSFLRGDHNDGYPFDGKGIVLAHAFFPGEGIGGDAHFDAEEPWVHGEPQPGIEGVSLFAVAAHEFGHSLGLSHSSVPGSLMNPFYQIIKENFQLPRDDTFGIQSLYEPRTPVKWEPLAPYDPTPYIPPTARPRPRPGAPTSRTHPTQRTRHPSVRPTEPTEVPYTCNTTFDAISIIRRELFIFKGNYFWRLNSQGLMKDYPVTIQRFWDDPELRKIDAAYERPLDTKIVFFSGRKYWLFEGNRKVSGYPKPLTDLGLPFHLKRVDAAMVWGHNGKTYLFSGNQYWRYDEAEGRVELDYPRDMAMWRGVPYHVDAAFQNTDGYTYFFKGRRYWRFDDQHMRVHNEKPGNVNQYWFGCPSRNEHLLPSSDDDSEYSSDDVNAAANSNSERNTVISLILIAMFLRWTMHS